MKDDIDGTLESDRGESRTARHPRHAGSARRLEILTSLLRPDAVDAHLDRGMPSPRARRRVRPRRD